MEKVMKYLFDSRSAERVDLFVTRESKMDRLINGLLSGSAIKMFQ
jgi:hypothetical protein